MGFVKISVIIPTLNEASFIETSIRSAFSINPHETIIVDGGSEDSTVELALKLGAFVENSVPGRGKQLNVGASKATGNVLLFLHADSQLSADCGDQIRKAVADGARCGFFKQRIRSNRSIYRVLEAGNFFRGRILQMPYGDQAVFVASNIFAEANGFREIPLMEDFEFSRRVKKNHRFHWLEGPVFVSHRRWEKNGAIWQTLTNWNTVLRYWMGVSAERLAENYYGDANGGDQMGAAK